MHDNKENWACRTETFLLEKSKVWVDIVLSSFKFRLFIRLNTDKPDFWIGYQIGIFWTILQKIPLVFSQAVSQNRVVFESVIESADRF